MIVYSSTDIVSNNLALHVIKKLHVSIGNPYHVTSYVLPNTTIGELEKDLQLQFDGFIVVANETEQVLNKTSMIKGDTVLKLCHSVAVSGALSNVFIVEHGTKLSNISDLTDYFNSSYVIHRKNDTNSVLLSDTPVVRDIFAVIAEVSHQEIVIKFDKENITAEEVENAIKDLIEVPNDEHVWIEVVSQGDNSFVISVKQTGTEEIGVAESLKECSLSNL